MASERRHRWRRDRTCATAESPECPDESDHRDPRQCPDESAHQDPRKLGGAKEVRSLGRGRNSESFDPQTTLVRPDLRVLVGPKRSRLEKRLRHDDIVVVPEFLCAEDDLQLYHALLADMKDLQDQELPETEWVSWHEGCHLINKQPGRAPSFQRIVDQLVTYFNVDPDGEMATRFNWYKDSSDWKPFHHDAAAFSEYRADRQNITISASFGAERELAFHHAKHNTLAYFPMSNGCVLSFGKDVNIRWKHAINALPCSTTNSCENRSESSTGGRISIILWGRCRYVVDEEGSPPLLTEGGKAKPGKADELCRDFIKGFCHNGNSCEFRHF